ncbi:unnamed protein product [Sphagnum troendelagicum]|uniref:RING-type domain-containing protein n=1 Tax=Sphagnum troendelagicum TaxID=128251 RepID=A0ABP0UKU1_9BRYO
MFYVFNFVMLLQHIYPYIKLNPSVGTHTLSSSFRPSIAVIIGVLTTMFSLTFLLLLYAKHCKRSNLFGDRGTGVPDEPLAAPYSVPRSNSGIDRLLVEALPMFTFASLQGLKEGLECAVCLCRYEDNEILRLLPKCKHAFHVDCVDLWLASHSTCPLCRHCVSSEDLTLVEDSVASRHSVIVPQDNVDRVVLTLKPESSKRRDGLLLGDPHVDHIIETKPLTSGRRLGHRIIISDVVMRERWSDFAARDVLLLNTQLLFGLNERLSVSRMSSCSRNDLLSPLNLRTSPNRPEFILVDGKRLSTRIDQRSLSDLTSVERVADSRKKDQVGIRSSDGPQNTDNERTRQWLSIARKTLNRLVGREKRIPSSIGLQPKV